MVPRDQLWATTIRWSWWLFAVGGVTAAVLGFDAAVGPWLWIAAVVLGGLTHGAGDALDAPRSPTRRAAWWCAYGIGIALLWVAAASLPVVSLAVFIVLTCWHFGAADARALRTMSSDIRPEPASLTETAVDWLSGTGRIAIFFGASLAADPSAVLGVATALLPHLGADAGSMSAVSVASVEQFAWLLLICGLLAWVSTGFGRALAGSAGRGACGVDVAETLGLAAAALVLDPLFAVGLYFLCWHAPRELGRRGDQVRAVPRVAPHRRGRWWSAMARYHTMTAWLWLPIVPVWVAMGWLREPPASSQPVHWAAAFIALCVVLTPIHHALELRRDLPDRG